MPVNEIEQYSGMQFFSNSPDEIEQKLRGKYSLRKGYLPGGGRAKRGNPRTQAHLKGLDAQRLADKLVHLGLVDQT